ncbi:hypothetical protein pb186bvf_003253 [Paramecium bursaria]
MGFLMAISCQFFSIYKLKKRQDCRMECLSRLTKKINNFGLTQIPKLKKIFLPKSLQIKQSRQGVLCKFCNRDKPSTATKFIEKEIPLKIESEGQTSQVKKFKLLRICQRCFIEHQIFFLDAFNDLLFDLYNKLNNQVFSFVSYILLLVWIIKYMRKIYFG